MARCYHCGIVCGEEHEFDLDEYGIAYHCSAWHMAITTRKFNADDDFNYALEQMILRRGAISFKIIEESLSVLRRTAGRLPIPESQIKMMREIINIHENKKTEQTP